MNTQEWHYRVLSSIATIPSNDSIDMTQIMLLLRETPPPLAISPVKSMTRAQRRQSARRYYGKT